MILAVMVRARCTATTRGDDMKFVAEGAKEDVAVVSLKTESYGVVLLVNGKPIGFLDNDGIFELVLSPTAPEIKTEVKKGGTWLKIGY